MSSSSKARERITSLLDENSFVEVGALVTARATDFNLTPAATPSDGVVTGYGTIDGNLVYVYSQDAEVLGGSVGEMHARKIASIYDMAVRCGAPVIAMLDSTGLRLQEASDALNAIALIYKSAARASGVVPQIAAVFGTCGGGLALIPGLSDFTFMAKDAKLFVNTPDSIKGNNEKKEDTAAAQFKAEAGAVDLTGTEEEVLGQIRTLVNMLPSNNEDEAVEECTDDLNRACENAAAGVGDPAVLVSDLADNGVFFELKKAFAPAMATGFIKLNGSTVGVVANRSVSYDENGKEAETFDKKLSAKGCEKAARFVQFCDAFEIPVLTITNVNGFMACECNEKKIGNAAASLAATFAGATVPKVNLITEEAMGSAYAVMNSKGLGADLTIAFPDAKIGTMEADLAAKIIADGRSAEEIADTAKQYDELQNNVKSAAARGYVDQIAQPEDIRKYLIGAFEMLYTKREDAPSRKHAAI